jgi:predicted nucleic acid-binding protein
MDLAVDTNVLVYAQFERFAEHLAARRAVERILGATEDRLVLSPLVCHEWLHIVTDPRRFDPPLPMTDGIRQIEDLAAAANVLVVSVDELTLRGALALLAEHQLGRKRIADTLLAACLRAAGIGDLLTANADHFRAFSFLKIHEL